MFKYWQNSRQVLLSAEKGYLRSAAVDTLYRAAIEILHLMIHLAMINLVINLNKFQLNKIVFFQELWRPLGR